jgi:hypothetical protein
MDNQDGQPFTSDCECRCASCPELIVPGDLISATPAGYVHAGRCL